MGDLLYFLRDKTVVKLIYDRVPCRSRRQLRKLFSEQTLCLVRGAACGSLRSEVGTVCACPMARGTGECAPTWVDWHPGVEMSDTTLRITTARTFRTWVFALFVSVGVDLQMTDGTSTNGIHRFAFPCQDWPMGQVLSIPLGLEIAPAQRGALCGI